MKLSAIVAGGLIGTTLLIGGGYWYAHRNGDATPSLPHEDDQVMCTMEAFMCPDGSYVGRVPPTCAFAECPLSSGTTVVPGLKETTKEIKLGERIVVAGIAITPTHVVEDSRCPSNVVCIQAGTARVQVVVRNDVDGWKDDTLVLTLNKAAVYQGRTITLVGVYPYPRAGQSPLNEEYRFVFLVETADQVYDDKG